MKMIRKKKEHLFSESDVWATGEQVRSEERRGYETTYIL
jgi:hypothetical protein